MSDDFWKREKQKGWLADAEKSGHVADSMDVRLDIVRRMNAGEITLAQGQALLAKIKRGAKAAGKVTRSQAYQGHLPPSAATGGEGEDA
jgi:hypothetical protein